MAKVAVLGYGTVGSGVVEVLTINKESISNKVEQDIDIKYILDLKEFPGSGIEHLLIKDYNMIIEDEEIDVIIEVMGGIEPAFTFVKQALSKGKSVATSNKELVAKHGPELLEMAKENNANFLFEASVGGGIPIIRPLNNSLTADEIDEIVGILNGTTNFILTKMKEEGLAFDIVLKEAQDLGYAERNPEADIEGYDACRKIAILSSLAFGKHVAFEDIYTEGISKITKKDMEYAGVLNMDIKLLGKCKKIDGQIYAMVAPMLLESNHPLSSVHGVFNAILIKGNVIGDVMFYGAGAGKLPTASAVVADVIDAVKHKGKNIITKWSTKQKTLMPIESIPSYFFVRVGTDNVETTKIEAESILGALKWVKLEGENQEIGFMTVEIEEGIMTEKIEELKAQSSIIDIRNIIRIER